MTASPRCSACGQRRAADLDHRYVACPDHPGAELVTFTIGEGRALHYMDRVMREDCGLDHRLEPGELADFARDADLDTWAGVSREDMVLAAIYLARWHYLMEKGRPGELVTSSRGLFG